MGGTVYLLNMAKTEKSSQAITLPPNNRIWQYVPFLVFALALAVRLIVLLQLAENYPGFDEPSIDSRWHLLWAREIAAGDWLGTTVFFRAPLYPYFLACIINLFGDSLWVIRFIQAILGSLTAVLVYYLGRRVFDRRIGAVASVIWALWATTIYYESEFLIPVLIIPLNLWALYRLAGAVKKKSFLPRSALLTGLILGFSAIARPNILIFVAGFIIWLYWRYPLGKRGRKLLWVPICAMLAGVSLPIAVVTLRNAVVTDDFVLIANQGGINLYLGNNRQSDGLTMIMPDIRADRMGDWSTFTRITDSLACVQAGRPLKPSEISNFWMGKAIDSVLAHPGVELGLLTKKLFYFWHGFENGDQWDIYRHVRHSGLLQTGLWHRLIWFPFGLISAFGLWGMWAARRDDRRVEMLTVFVLVYMFSVVGFLVTARHRLPVTPIVILFAVLGIIRLWNLLTKKTQLFDKIGAAFSVVILLVITNVSLFNVGLANDIQYHYQQGIIFDRKGDYNRAIAAYQRALAIWPNHFLSRHNLAYDLYRQGDYEAAIEHFTWALGARPGDAQALNNIGLAYREAGDTSNAIGAFDLALHSNPRLIEAYLNKGNTHRGSGNHQESEQAYIAAITIDSTYGPALNNLGLLYIDIDRRDKAEETFKLGINNAPDYPFCWSNLGAIYLETQRPNFAIKALTKFLQFRPDRLEARFNLAMAYLRTGRVSNARAQIEKILSQNPDHPRARALLEQIINQGK